MKSINRVIYFVLNKLITGYRYFLSPLLPARCRFYPTCSQYAQQALAWHGVWYGSWLTVKRLSRCQPFGGHGIDFVPIPLYRYQFVYVRTDAKEGAGINGVYQSQYCYRAYLNYLINLTQH